jgi:DNA-damage-inducible protein J
MEPPFPPNLDADEYDAWFRAAIQEALDDPRPLIPHAEVEAHFAKRRSDALRKVKKV